MDMNQHTTTTTEAPAETISVTLSEFVLPTELAMADMVRVGKGRDDFARVTGLDKFERHCEVGTQGGSFHKVGNFSSIERRVEVVMPKVQVGDVFVNSWGYDQTNIDFYVVTSVSKSGKTVEVAPSGKTVVSDSGEHTQVSATGEAVGESTTKRPRATLFNGVAQWNLPATHGFCPMWSGEPKHETGAGYGH